MNHVYVVRNTGIEEVKMSDDLAKMVNIVSKPINADLLFHLHGLRANNLGNPTLKYYYGNVLELETMFNVERKNRRIVEYRNVENLSAKWFRDMRLVLAIIANECGEKNIANFTKPSSTFDAKATLLSCCNTTELLNAVWCESTFIIVTDQDKEDSIGLDIKHVGDIAAQYTNIQKGDVILFAERRLMDHATITFKSPIELLTLDVNPAINTIGLQNMEFEDYLKGNMLPTDYVKSTLKKIDNVPFTYKWTSGKE